MNDWQLAIFLARVVDKPDSILFFNIIRETVLPKAQKQKDQGLCMFLECLLRGTSERERDPEKKYRTTTTKRKSII